MPGFALSPRLVKIRNNYSNDEFFRDLFIVAGVIFSGGLGLGTGAGSVAARGFIGRLASAGYVKFKGQVAFFIGTLFAKLAEELYEWAKSGDLNADAAVKALIFETTGLDIKTLDKEGAKRAIGVYIADFLNEKIPELELEPIYPLENTIDNIGKAIAKTINAKAGTTFTNVYPPDNFIAELKLEFIAEVQKGGGALLSSADVSSILATIKSRATDTIVQAVGIYLPVGTSNSGVPLSTKEARRRAQLRAAQKKYRLTHKRNYTWIPK